MASDLKVFSGRSNRPLAEKIAAELGKPLGSCEIRDFSDGEMWVKYTENIRGSDLFIVQSTIQPTNNLLELLMMIDAATNGVTVRPIISMGWEHATNETFYEDVRVPASQVVGEVNRGWYVGMTLLDYERSGVARSVALRKAMDELVTYVREDPMPNRRELVRGELADRYIESEVLDNLCIRIASMHASGNIPNYEASMGKMYGSELAQRIARTGIKAFGLRSNLWSSDDGYAPLHAAHTQNYCHTVVGTIAGGSNEIQRNIIATRGLGLPRG